jgi:glycosyltransferase involved in cell wall biosynthesis
MAVGSEAEKTTRLAFKPLDSPYNPFTRLLADAIVAAMPGASARHFSWTPRDLLSSDVLILHWPDYFFSSKGLSARLGAIAKLVMLVAYRRLLGRPAIWLAHNTEPHEIDAATPWIAARFFGALSGVVFLSRATEAAALARYPALAGKPRLVVRHGVYPPPDPALGPAPRPEGDRVVRLLYFGAVRGYKGVEDLVRAVAASPDPDLRLTVLGRVPRGYDPTALRTLAGKDGRIALDLREGSIAQDAVDVMMLESDAVVLPYNRIGNSGVAILALSAGRPILAPDAGSLPELRADCGATWVTLFGGALDADVLGRFAADLRAAPRRGGPDLSAYAWDRIGPDWAAFIARLAGRR